MFQPCSRVRPNGALRVPVEELIAPRLRDVRPPRVLGLGETASKIVSAAILKGAMQSRLSANAVRGASAPEESGPLVIKLPSGKTALFDNQVVATVFRSASTGPSCTLDRLPHEVAAPLRDIAPGAALHVGLRFSVRELPDADKRGLLKGSTDYLAHEKLFRYLALGLHAESARGYHTEEDEREQLYRVRLLRPITREAENLVSSLSSVATDARRARSFLATELPAVWQKLNGALGDADLSVHAVNTLLKSLGFTPRPISTDGPICLVHGRSRFDNDVEVAIEWDSRNHALRVIEPQRSPDLRRASLPRL